MAGYLLDGATVQTNPSGPFVYISFAGTSNITPVGTDTLGWLRYTKVNTSTGGDVFLSIGNALFDEYLNARVSTGQLSFQGLPTIGISPSGTTLYAGQTQQFNATGSPVAPLVWGVTDPSVGSIDGSGLFTALNNGTTQVTLMDDVSNTAISGTITVNDAGLEVVNVQGPVGGEVWVPVITSTSANNEDIYAYQITFSHSTSQLNFQAWETVGTGSESWLVFTSTSSNQITVTAAGAVPFQPGGLIGYLRFQLQPAFTTGNSAVNIVSSLFNEGDPVMVHDNGAVSTGQSGSPLGCTNPYACNYDPFVVVDDGSCLFDPASCIVPCPGDINGDLIVNVQDFLIFNGSFGSTCSSCPADLNEDGVVNVQDFLIFNGAFGNVCD